MAAGESSAHVHDCGCVPPNRAGWSNISLVWACWLTSLTVCWNALEAAVGIFSGIQAHSIALIAFALDSVVEVAAGFVVAWKLTLQGEDSDANERIEQRAVRLIALTFFAIAAYVAYDSSAALLGLAPEPRYSVAGLVMVALSVLVMPLLARAKRQVARRLDSAAISADAAESQLCMWLSAAVLIGLTANRLAGWWWLDPAAGLIVAAAAVWEGRRAWISGDTCC